MSRPAIAHIRLDAFRHNYRVAKQHYGGKALAVIKANLTQLMQSTTLSESDMNNLQTIENTTKKMASLNKALILLSKIENNQFKENELISVNKIINKVINNFADLIEVKNIKLNLNLKDDLQLTINPTLAEILLSN